MSSARACATLCVLTAVTLCLLAIGGASADSSGVGQWFTGRVTRYGAPGDPWSIHNGACHYGYLDPHKASGWNVAAMADADSGFSGSCGRCYELACQNMKFKDNYGNSLDRSSVCYNSNASVVVQITDACPCNYPANAYSNKRWCCGDMFHMDLSQWAFEELADPKWGVIGMKFREVPCGYVPANPPQPIANPTTGYPPPSGWTSSMDKRPWP